MDDNGSTACFRKTWLQSRMKLAGMTFKWSSKRLRACKPRPPRSRNNERAGRWGASVCRERTVIPWTRCSYPVASRRGTNSPGAVISATG